MRTDERALTDYWYILIVICRFGGIVPRVARAVFPKGWSHREGTHYRRIML